MLASKEGGDEGIANVFKTVAPSGLKLIIMATVGIFPFPIFLLFVRAIINFGNKDSSSQLPFQIFVGPK